MSWLSQPEQPALIVSLAAPEDARRLAQWETHLLPLQMAGLVSLWSERHLTTGSEREGEMNQHVEQADIVLLLLSSDFFASSECQALMVRALQRARQGRAHAIPLLLRPVAWRATELGRLACLPANGRPITRWGDRDAAFYDCVESISTLLNQSEATLSMRPSRGYSDLPEFHTSPEYMAPHAPAYSCSLHHAHQDGVLALRLSADLLARGVPCRLAPQDRRVGPPGDPQEKLLLLLSQHALASTWIEYEVEAMLERERREQRELLFPLRLDESILHASAAWATRLRRTCQIGDFTNWTDQEAYEQALADLQRDFQQADE